MRVPNTQWGIFKLVRRSLKLGVKHVVFFCNLLNYMVVNGDGVNCGLITLYGFYDREGGKPY